MELDFEPMILGITAVLYILVVVIIWIFNAGMMTWDMPIKTKILASIFMIPITYLIVNGMAGQN